MCGVRISMLSTGIKGVIAKISGERNSGRYRQIAVTLLAAGLMLVAGNASAQWSVAPPPPGPPFPSGATDFGYRGLCVDLAGVIYYSAGLFGDCDPGNFAGNVPAGTSINFGSGGVTAASFSDGGGTTISGGVVTTNTLNVTGQANLTGGASISNNLTVSPATTVNMGGNRIMDVGVPLASTDAATKGYVDQGLGAANSRIDQAFNKIDENKEGIGSDLWELGDWVKGCRTQRIITSSRNCVCV